MSDLARWKVRGPVRTLRQEVAEWDPGRDAWHAPRHFSAVTFRPDGQVAEGESHNPDGSVARWARVYDDDGRVIEAQSWKDEGPRTAVLYSYDDRGRLAGTVEVAPDGTRRQVETCRYDSAGRRTKLSFLAAQPTGMAVTYAVEGTEHAYGAPGAVTVTVVYDDRELPADMSFHDANGGLVRRIVFSRDTEGHPLTEVVHFGGETPFPGSPAEAGNILPEERAKLAAVMKTAFADQVFAHTTYAYDQKGRLLERTMRMGALSEERTTFQYDEHDNPIAETSERRAREMHIDDDGVALTREEEPRVQEQRFDYQYDDRGNWTERVVRGSAGSPPTFESSNIERRTITYHEL